jgi:outer membrane protein assembly factor BamB
MRLRVVLVASIFSMAGLGRAWAQEWPQWRGPARDGSVPAFGPLKAWPKALRPAWSVAVGEGHSSPVVSGGKAYLFSREGEEEVLSAFDLATGRAVWRQSWPAPYTMNPAASRHGKGPKATPVAGGAHVCALGISGTLSCHDAATGKTAWRKTFAGQFRESAPLYGAAASPLIVDGLLVAHVGGHGNGALTAFDLKTGAPRWSWTGDGPAYASPVMGELAGVRQLVTLAQTQLVGLSLDRGRPLWSVPFTTDYDQNSVTPVIAQSLVVYGGVGQPTRAVRVVRRGNDLVAEPAWENAAVSLYMSTPVARGDALFGFSHRQKGQFFSLDAKTGATRWLGPTRQGDNASVIAAGEVVLFLTSEGELTVVRAEAPAFAPVARYAVAEGATWAHPALAGRALVVKDAGTLALFRIE